VVFNPLICARIMRFLNIISLDANTHTHTHTYTHILVHVDLFQIFSNILDIPSMTSSTCISYVNWYGSLSIEVVCIGQFLKSITSSYGLPLYTYLA
jgi:hypothetical protein